jgi:hypothetical protein
MLRAENLLAPLDGEIFHGVHMLTPTVVPFSRVSFGVLIGHERSLGRQNRGTGEIFRGDQKQLLTLSLLLGRDCGIDIRVCGFECV